MDSHHMTKRGKFRDLNMKEFQEKAHLPIWGKEQSQLEYQLPFNANIPGIGSASRKLAKQPTVIPEEELGRVSSVLTAASPQSHIGPFATAIDFLIPDGTEVLAAHEGKVIEIQEHSDSWGNSPEYRDLLNYMTIEHEGGEFSQYAHLGQYSARDMGVVVGTRVEVGQPVAVVGKTGWTDRDHLHFIVFKLVPKTKDNPFGFIGVHPRWA